MTTRREMISYTVALAGSMYALPVRSQDVERLTRQDGYDFARQGLGLMSADNDPDFGALIRGKAPGHSGVAVSSGASRHTEVSTAFRLLFNKELLSRASNQGPIGVARYLKDLKAKNKQDEFYNAEWKTRANPLIVCLFGLTNTEPAEGDETQWCSAFVNFCLYAAGKNGTYSALSGSFRNFGTATASPQLGDIVVFEAKGESGKRGHGHVGFFVRKDGESIIVLGGNQGGLPNSTGAVTERAFPPEGKSLVLNSFRKVPI